jgi:protein SCO1/2
MDKQAATADINNEPIPNFMDSMVMPYPIKPPAALDQIHPGDSITADVVVAEPGKYWLENVKVTGHSNPAAGK